MRRLALAVFAAFAAVAFALPAAALAQEIRLRMGHDQPLGSMYDEGHQMFKKLVEERSQGKIRVDVFPAAQLGVRSRDGRRRAARLDRRRSARTLPMPRR